jgi:dienelactone hydrolase
MIRIATAFSLLLASGAAAQERPASFLRLPAPAGIAVLVTPDVGAEAPLVVILPDAIGADLRAELYVDSLLARGIATLRVGLGFDQETTTERVEPAASKAAIAPALGWAVQAGFAPHRVALLGFGLGGRAVLAGAEGLPAVALYPVCSGLHLAGGGPSLILQGADDAEACDTLALPHGVALTLLPDAGHAWDAPGAIWPSAGPVLSDPAGNGLRRARTDGETTRAAAELVAEWVELHLRPPVRSAAK